MQVSLCPWNCFIDLQFSKFHFIFLVLNLCHFYWFGTHGLSILFLHHFYPLYCIIVSISSSHYLLPSCIRKFSSKTILDYLLFSLSFPFAIWYKSLISTTTYTWITPKTSFLTPICLFDISVWISHNHQQLITPAFYSMALSSINNISSILITRLKA